MQVHYLHCENISLLPDAGPADNTAGQITVWTVDIQKQRHRLPGLEQLLTTEERARAARFHQQKDAHQFIVTRAVLRILLADVISVPPEEITIVLPVNQKPALSGNQGLYFNVSHSGNQAVLAIAQQPVGIDLEEIQPDFDYLSVAEFAFSNAESASLQQSRNPLQEFFRIWTRKEALLKGLGTGLINDLKLISCLDGTTAIHPAVKDVKAGWDIKTTEYAKLYMMSIAFEHLTPATQIRLLEYQ